jgi:hypothetical protein
MTHNAFRGFPCHMLIVRFQNLCVETCFASDSTKQINDKTVSEKYRARYGLCFYNSQYWIDVVGMRCEGEDWLREGSEAGSR